LDQRLLLSIYSVDLTNVAMMVRCAIMLFLALQFGLACAFRRMQNSERTSSLNMWGNKKPAEAGGAPKSKSADVAFGSSKPKTTTTAKKQTSTVVSQDENDPLYKARRITRWIMFPGIFGKFDDTEERMKKTIKIERGLSDAEFKRLIERNPDMYK